MISIPKLYKNLTASLKAKRLQKNQKGIALIEFAIAAPVLTALLMSTIDLTVYLVAHQRIARSAYTMSNLMTQMDQGLTEAQVSDMMLALNQVSSPFDVSTDGVATITAIIGQGLDGQAADSYSVAWQRCYGVKPSGSKFGTAGTAVAIGDFPDNTIVTTSQILVVTEVDYTFTPILGFLPLGGQIEYDAYFRPRRGTIENIIGNGATPGTC